MPKLSKDAQALLLQIQNYLQDLGQDETVLLKKGDLVQAWVGEDNFHFIGAIRAIDGDEAWVKWEDFYDYPPDDIQELSVLKKWNP